MKAHIVLAHPEPNSFNGQLAGLSRTRLSGAGYEGTVSDLYSMGFDAREGPQHFPDRKDGGRFHTQTEQRHSADEGMLPPEIDAEIERLLRCDLLVVHFPLWWFGPPAILKGWMDRTFVYGRVYRSAMRYDAGICRGKRMIACVTTGASADHCAHNGREGDTRLLVWPILFPFRYLGFDVLQPDIMHGVGGVAFMEGHEDGLGTMETMIRGWTRALEHIASRPAFQFNRDADFDDRGQLLPEARELSPFIRHQR